METANLTRQEVQALALDVYRQNQAAEKKGKQLLTRDEIIALFSALPEESERKFEVDVVGFSVDWDESIIQNELTQFLAPVKAGTANAAEEQLAFSAFCVLVNYERRMKNFSAEERWLQDWQDCFGGHIFYNHMLLLSQMGQLENFRETQWNEFSIRDLLQLARKNSAALCHNVGGLHAFAETVALAYENTPALMTRIQETDHINWLNSALAAIEETLRVDPDYAKFYCTYARLLAAGGDYDAALNKLSIAIDKENSQRPDYAIRVGRYLTFSQQFRARKELVSMETTMQTHLEQYKSALDDQEKQTLVKNMEFLGLFSGIVSFTIGSLTISGAIAEQSIKSAAGLIVVLMGALMGVFAAFGIILHGASGKKALRNILVLLMGFAAVIGGIAFCLN